MHSNRGYILIAAVSICMLVVVIRFFQIQVIDQQYKERASNNFLRHEVVYPPRGYIYDRNGEILVQNEDVYDLMAIPRDVKQFDTLLLCSILEITPEQLNVELQKARNYSPRLPSVVFKQLSKSGKVKFEERTFPGFYTVHRTIRSYPQKVAGNLLGYISEVDRRGIERDGYYRSGDYIGKSGVELSYEQHLRGEKGVKVNIVDVHGLVKGSYANGSRDTLPIPGSSLTSTIDLRLQVLGERLLEGKVGSIVAIEPSTGEILMMVSTPGYDPDELVGKRSGNNYMKLLGDQRKPLFNRAVMSRYPPGSIFKIVNGLIGLQEGTLKSSYKYSCYGGYFVGKGVKCHRHSSPTDLIGAVQTSCNTYFCHVFRNALDNPKYDKITSSFDVWEEYVRSFGFGRKLNSDFIDELNGTVPTSDLYTDIYRVWNSLTTLSLAIGQGELGCSPLQMANLAAIIANRGHYYIPHVVNKIEGLDSVDQRFYQSHSTMVDAKHFDPIVEGMYRAVNVPGGTALLSRIAGIDMCGKTGTAENPHGADHSTFMCFAPRNDPKIAVSVYVEHGGFGSVVAAPIASLIVELYLTGKMERTWLENFVKERELNYYYYDRQ